MMQGDAYGLSVEILNSDGTAITPDDISNVEISVGNLIKTYKGGQVSFDTASNHWVFKLTQEETFKILPSKVKAQVRVRWKNGNVEGAPLGEIRVHESISKEVLST